MRNLSAHSFVVAIFCLVLTIFCAGCAAILSTPWKVLVSTKSLTPGSFITKSDVKLSTASSVQTPVDALSDISFVLGKQVREQVKSGQFLSLQDLDLPDAPNSHYDRILCAKKAIPLGTRIDNTMIQVLFVNRHADAGSCLTSPTQVLGKKTLHSLAPNQAMFLYDLSPEHELLKQEAKTKSDLVVYMKEDCAEGRFISPELLKIEHLHTDDEPSAKHLHSIHEAAGWIAKYGITAQTPVDRDYLTPVSDLTVHSILK